MKKLFVYSILFLSLCSCAQESSVKKLIQPDELAILLEKGEIQLADVRTQGEYDKGFIKGAVLIDFYKDDFVKRMSETFDKKKPVYVYCARGGRSNKASLLLLQNGFQKVYDLDGGYSKWTKNLKK
ncbi:rhodanese-like domain-containing protein [Pseudotenacibaculum sp. MALMAid0570]|uniref:rhodanese-like domain-containing protein n=1 Tax=Pseudotenacibaculum sp. MALMAid0570 TaxID=3143938 RepID=UPI0032DFB583